MSSPRRLCHQRLKPCLRSLVVLDPDGEAGDLYRITGLPTTIFIREDGTIEGRYIGQTSEQILGSHIAAIGA